MNSEALQQLFEILFNLQIRRDNYWRKYGIRKIVFVRLTLSSNCFFFEKIAYNPKINNGEVFRHVNV